jgi:hypothetical protein
MNLNYWFNGGVVSRRPAAKPQQSYLAQLSRNLHQLSPGAGLFE